MRFLSRLLWIYLTIASSVVPVESFLDSFDFLSNKNQYMEIDDDNYSIGIPVKTQVEFDSEAIFFSNSVTHFPFLLIPSSLFSIISSSNPFSSILVYNLLYLPPPIKA
jgi:hypothetical protein